MIMYLGLVPRVQSQVLSWQHQDVHHCANEVATLATLCEYVTAHARFGSIHTALTTKLLYNPKIRVA